MFTNNWNAIYKNGSYVRCSECFREWSYASNVENTVHLIFLFLLYKSSKKLSTSAILLNLNIESWRF